MNPSRRTILLAAPLLLALSALARAQEAFPSRPVTIIAAGAAGGPTDTITRIVADNMGRHLGQPVVGESIGGSLVGPQRAGQGGAGGFTGVVKKNRQGGGGPPCRPPAPPTAR